MEQLIGGHVEAIERSTTQNSSFQNGRLVQPKRRFVEALQNMDIEIVKAMVNKIALKGVSQIIYGRLENSRRNIGDVRISVQ